MFNIAIDGPSASGKSTIAKRLAKELGFTHIDTGAMYRAVGYYCLTNGVDLDDEKECVLAANNIDLNLKTDGSVFVNGEDVSSLIRNDKVSYAASKVSKFAGVRQKLVDMQRKIASKKGYVLDGRDITSVVLPDAEVKVYQTADVSVRAKRRYDEMINSGMKVDFDEIYDDLVERDYRDMNRSESPLIKVDDALEINTTYLEIDDVVNLVKEYIESRGLND
ncbi:(d)CMP kinase [Erysipelothrix inopinata]|uniref:Cytidylate kinase n=1 Tax=Erysipelothrix inopinata TaxID=225084 RepID=A0A7G9RXU6_9FIRM|nr:(d)CMP kinase [Erysipelothrix inopinata]QNN60421.1 (d)CMP kinase [Erysipelothrix inopinata]